MFSPASLRLWVISERLDEGRLTAYELEALRRELDPQTTDGRAYEHDGAFERIRDEIDAQLAARMQRTPDLMSGRAPWSVDDAATPET